MRINLPEKIIFTKAAKVDKFLGLPKLKSITSVMTFQLWMKIFFFHFTVIKIF